MTTFAVKQGGIAAQQADAIAARIALLARASVALPPSTLTLRVTPWMAEQGLAGELQPQLT